MLFSNPRMDNDRVVIGTIKLNSFAHVFVCSGTLSYHGGFSVQVNTAVIQGLTSPAG
jgi:hypothetical protein